MIYDRMLLITLSCYIGDPIKDDIQGSWIMGHVMPKFGSLKINKGRHTVMGSAAIV